MSHADPSGEVRNAAAGHAVAVLTAFVAGDVREVRRLVAEEINQSDDVQSGAISVISGLLTVSGALLGKAASARGITPSEMLRELGITIATIDD